MKIEKYVVFAGHVFLILDVEGCERDHECSRLPVHDRRYRLIGTSAASRHLSFTAGVPLVGNYDRGRWKPRPVAT